MAFFEWKKGRVVTSLPVPSQKEAPVDLTTVPDALPNGPESPVVDWGRVHDWLEAHVTTSERAVAWTEAGAQWLGRLRRLYFGEDYRLYEGQEVLLLSPFDSDTVRRVLKTGDWVFQHLVEQRGERPEGREGKLALLHLPAVETYYDYVSQFYPDDGEYATSAGMFIGVGYWHVVLYGGALSNQVLAHEITHAMLSDLELPQWLDEGMAQLVEDDLSGGGGHFTAEEVLECRRAWCRGDLGDFWSGAGFHTPTRQRASYFLARQVVRALVFGHPQDFREFLLNASRKDAGISAARGCLHVDLERHAMELLGV